MVSVDKQGEAEDEAPAVGDEPEASAAPGESDEPGDTSRTFPLDVTSAGADRLRTTVKTKLSEFMGSYTDDVLAAYVVVLVGHGKQRKQAIADLEAFLGSQSEAFVSWLWDHLTENLNDYAQQASEEGDKELVAETIKELTAEDEKQDAKESNAAKESEPAAGQGEKPKRGRSPEPWSRRRRTRTETKEKESSPPKEQEKESVDPPPPRLRAPRRLLEFAVRDAVAPSAGATRRNPDATTKRLRSVVATDHDKSSETNGKLKPRPTIAKQTNSSPAMLIALKAAAAAAEDVANRKPAAIKALSRFNSSVWDRLGGKSDDDVADHQSLREAENEITEKMEYVHVSSKSSGKAAERHLRRSGSRASAADHPYGDEQNDHQQVKEALRKESKRHSVKKDRRLGKPERVSQSEKPKAILLAERRSKPLVAAEANHVAREKTIDAPDVKDQDVSEMKKRMRQVELEVSKLRTKQVEATKPPAASVVVASSPSQAQAPAAQGSSQDPDLRTVTVSNVHFSTTKEALSAHFACCGEVVKATILTDAAGKPKGSAHVEFVSKEAADKALGMSDSNLHSRALKVARKDVNVAAAAASGGEASSSATPRPAAPPPPAAMMRPVRMPIRAFPRAAAFMRGSPYSLRPPPPRLLRPSFPLSAPHLQWKRDGTASTTPGSSKNGFRSNVAPIRKRSLSYVRPVVPSIPDASAALPAAAEEQKGS